MSNKVNTVPKQPKIPVILYEETGPGQKGSIIPFIEVTQDDTMPPVLFIFEYKDTGEKEPGSEGQDLAIVDQIPHQYIDMQFIKERLSPDLFDKLRIACGMKKLSEAIGLGEKILDKVYINMQNSGLPIEIENKKP